MKTSKTALVTALWLLAAASAAAQEAPNAPAAMQLRSQLQIFQGVLETAVRQGGDSFAREQAPFIPARVQLTANAPQARGFAPPQGGGGLLFYVAVPQIRVMINELIAQGFRARPDDLVDVQPLRPTGATRPGSVMPASGAGAQGIAPPDPMTVPPTDASTPVLDDGRCAVRAKPLSGDPTPSYWYHVSVCDALMDAMLDNSGALPVKETEWLTVMAVGEPDPPGLINSMSGYTTYLQIKGSDLVAYRQGRLSKEDARRLIQMNQR